MSPQLAKTQWSKPRWSRAAIKLSLVRTPSNSAFDLVEGIDRAPMSRWPRGDLRARLGVEVEENIARSTRVLRD
jgi:hypothetical protein